MIMTVPPTGYEEWKIISSIDHQSVERQMAEASQENWYLHSFCVTPNLSGYEKYTALMSRWVFVDVTENK